MRATSLLVFVLVPLALPLLSCSGRTADPGTGHKSQASGELPCAVDQVLTRNCRKCHTDPPSYGSPMSLMTYSDLLAPAYSDPSVPVYKMIEKRIHGGTSRSRVGSPSTTPSTAAT